MIKKLLFTFCLLFSFYAFSQKSMSSVRAVPNPFDFQTKIEVSSTVSQPVFFSVKNVLGRVVYKKQITLKPGKNEILFQKNDLHSGMYIYTLQNKSELISKRFVIK